MNRGTVLLRVDGLAETGMGRLARCLAVANALQRRRYQMTFISRLDHPSWIERIRRFRHAVSRTSISAGSEEDRSELLAEIARRNPVMVITDSVDIDEEYLAMIATRVPLLVTLEETSNLRFPSDLVINPTLGRPNESYNLYPGTQLLAGAKYAMIRSEFRRARNVRATEPGGPTRVLISLGGGEVVASTLALARALLANSRIERIDAVVGTSSKGRKEIENFAAQYAERMELTGDAKDLGIRMTKAHLLIAGGGNTALEAACVGLPMILLTRSPAQRPNAVTLEEIGAAQLLGEVASMDAKQVAEAAVNILADNFERKAMSRSGRGLIDGRGADRIVTATEVLLRRARKAKKLAA